MQQKKGGMMIFIRENPGWFSAGIEALIVAVMNLILVFGVTVTIEQIAAINAVVVILTTLVLGVWTKTAIDRKVDRALAAQAESIARDHHH
jgi:uncharacterized membrane protein